MSSQRALNGFITKGSSAVIVTPAEFSGSNTLQKYDQGVYVNDINIFLGTSAVRLRPNNDFLKVRFGVRTQITEGPYNDTESPVSLVWVSGSEGSVYQKSYIPITFFQSVGIGSGQTTGKKYSGYGSAPSHYLLDNDFGQPDLYQDGSFFEEVEAFRGITGSLAIIESSDPEGLLVPVDIVNSTTLGEYDGMIDPFDVRREVDRSLIEVSNMRIKGMRGDMVLSDSYRRSDLIVDEYRTHQFIKIGSTQLPPPDLTNPFLDAADQFGIGDFFGVEFPSGTGPVFIEGYVQRPFRDVSPYVDSSDPEETALRISVGDTEMRSVMRSLSGSVSQPTHDYLARNHVSLPHGFDYDNSEFGIDSLAFGGLLKR